MLDITKSTCSKKAPTHINHKVVVKNGSSRAWRGNLKLLPSSSNRVVVKHGALPSCRGHLKLLHSDSSDTDSTENMSCCSSEFSSDILYSDKPKQIYSFYQEGDGSAEDPDHIPQRFLDMANQDRAVALEAVQKTIEWRNENGINDMLNKPHVNFDICKAVVPHYYLGRDNQGNVVYVQRPTRLNMEQVKANGLGPDDLLHHAIYIQEYLWQIVEADDANALVTSIIDAGDLCLSDLRGQKDRLELLTQMATVFDSHFPMRAHKTLIVNAPSWFNALWRLVKPVLRESTTEMIEICSKGKQQDEMLLKHLGEETSKSLPDFCWSSHKKRSSVSPIDELQMEKDLRDFVMSQIKANGETMAPVLP